MLGLHFLRKWQLLYLHRCLLSSGYSRSCPSVLHEKIDFPGYHDVPSYLDHRNCLLDGVLYPQWPKVPELLAQILPASHPGYLSSHHCHFKGDPIQSICKRASDPVYRSDLPKLLLYRAVGTESANLRDWQRAAARALCPAHSRLTQPWDESQTPVQPAENHWSRNWKDWRLARQACPLARACRHQERLESCRLPGQRHAALHGHGRIYRVL